MPSKLADRAAAEERRSRALESPLDVRWRSDPRFVHLDVRNPVHKSHYDVVFPAFPERVHGFCTCTDFAKRGLGTCKHIEAAWIWLSDRAGATEPLPEERSEKPLWDDIDRRIKAAGRLEQPEGLRVRYAGAALFSERRRAPGVPG